MLIFINALKSIVRSKGRNILIGIIVLTIAVSSSVALAIQNAATTAKQTALESQTITGTISVDRQKMMENAQSDGSNRENMREMMEKYSDLGLPELKSYSDSNYVKEFHNTSSISLNASGDIEAYGTEESTEPEARDPRGGSEVFSTGDGGQVRVRGMMAIGDFNVTGYSSESAMSRFLSGESKLTEGEMFDFSSSKFNCIISNELSTFNQLEIGDKISLVNPNNEEETYKFTIVGIYTNTTSETENQMRFSAAMDPANLIGVSAEAVNKIGEKSMKNAVVETDDYGNETSSALSVQTSGTYSFSNISNFESFKEELSTKGLSEYYVLSSSDISSYESSLVPLENLNEFAQTLLIIILLVGAIILIVLNIFNIRERKYEVGVLTAIGIKKAKVTAQFITELLAITLVAIIIGTGIGAVVSVPVANNLLQSQIQTAETQQVEQDQNFGRPGGNIMPGGGGMRILGSNEPTTPVEYINTINATININILLQLILIGIALTILSSLVGIIFVLRYDPLKILANRT